MICSRRLFVLQQWPSLALEVISTEAELFTEEARDNNGHSGEKEKSHDHKGEDPLESDHFDGELLQSKS